MKNGLAVGVLAGVLVLFSAVLLTGIPAAGAESSPYPADAPWPVMRGNLQNTGQGRFLKWQPNPDLPASPRLWRTGNGIFSTPVIGANERIYVGSADHFFYALDPSSGRVLWKFDARELMDSAAALSQDGRVYVPAGAALYALDQAGQEIWAFDVTDHRPEGLYTFGTNYWWEGNAVLGPEGNLYAGNNDFFFYSITPEGKMRWARRTGFLIWSVPAFAPDGALYFAGFDMRLYALERETGRLKWKKNLKNPLVASPALAPDGTIYQGSFDGKLYALDSRQGKIKWTLQTDSHIYASAAIDQQGMVYVPSTDGFLYALDGSSGRVRWTFYTGDAVRSSPVLGPDPEGKAEYLVYFGGGQGEVFALQPDGSRRWSFDTLTLAGRVDYPNLNASPALGRSGLAVASANGDVFYIPYDYYLQADARGIDRDPSEGFSADGARWHRVSPGGLIDRDPVPSTGPGSALSAHPSPVVILRLIVRQNGRTARARLNPGSVRTAANPAFAHRVEVFGDDRTVAIVPEAMLRPGQKYSLRVSSDYTDQQGGSGEVAGMIELQVARPEGESGFLQGEHPGFVITHMAFPQPPIVPSLDQIGIAIMRIPFAVVDVDRERNTFVAWAVQKYGESAGGEEQGIPDSRSLFYALAGQVQGDFFALESANCFFEESSFPFPLDRLRFAGRALPDGTVERGASLWAELMPPPMLKALSMLKVSSEEVSAGQESYVSRTLSGGGMKGFLSAARITLPTVVGYITNHIWRPWDLYNGQGRFISAGTFRLEPLPAGNILQPEGVAVTSFAYDPKKREIVGEVKVTDPRARQVMIGILLKDNSTGKPVPINYNIELRRQRLADGSKRTTLPLPDRNLHRGDLTAYLMADLKPLRALSIP